MKKLFSILMIVFLLLCAMPAESFAMADSRVCPYCGQEYDPSLGFAFCPNCGRELPKTGTSQEEEKTISNVSVGDIVLFGSYEQDNDTSNGKEKIEWIVLDVQDGKALLISRYALDCQPYNTHYTGITWEKCTLRPWLNDEFLNVAFSAEEQEQIQLSKVTADKNPSNRTNPGNDTTDQVFLLSINEVDQYFFSDSARQCNPTAYAGAQGCYEDSENGNCCWWWLRSPGLIAHFAADVYTDGSVEYSGLNVNYDYVGVRPALWVILDS